VEQASGERDHAAEIRQLKGELLLQSAGHLPESLELSGQDGG